jgi:AhpD family alkylhydroperoxidase
MPGFFIYFGNVIAVMFSFKRTTLRQAQGYACVTLPTFFFNPRIKETLKMSLLKTIEPAQAEGKVAEIYQQVKTTIGFIPNSFKMSSTNPYLLELQWQNIGYYIRHPTLSGKLFASIRLLVSITQQCQYCIDLNSGLLLKVFGVTPDQLAAMQENPQNAPLAEKEKHLLLFVLKTVSNSNSTSEADIQALRSKGCTDLEIYDTLSHGAQQVAADIMLNALKVERNIF